MTRRANLRSIGLLIAVSGLLIGPPAVHAQARKAAPPAKPAPAAAAKKPPEKPQGPADASLFAGDLDTSPEWFKKQEEVIAQLTDLIKTLPDGDIKATRLVQLAELHWQKSSRLHRLAVAKFNKVYDEWFMKDGAAKGIPEPKLDDRQADEVLKRASDIYVLVLKKYPDNSRADQAHYYLGQTYLGQAKKDEALSVFQKLVQRFPQSPYIPDAYLALGEFFFENKMLPQAIENYQKAARYPNAQNYGYAMYKLAWCYLNTVEYEKAVAAFKDVITFSIKAEKTGQKLEYKDQALKDLVLAYAHIGRVDEAEKYFKDVGGPEYFRKMLQFLGGTYFQQGRDDDSIAIYKRLISLDPMDGENLTYEGEILKAWIRKADRPQVLAQLDRIVQMVKPDSAWVRANQGQMEKIVQQRDALEGSVSKYAREVYEESRKLNAEQSFKGFQQAEKFCEYYLTTFPKAKNAYPIRMMLAETQYKLAGHALAKPDIKYQIAKFNAAGENYIRVVEMNPKGEFLNAATEGAIYAYDQKVRELVKTIRKDPRPAATDKQAKELPTEEKNVVAACDVYIKYNPKGPNHVKTRYTAAYLSYEYNQFDEAIRRFMDVVHAGPATQEARFAADLILNIFEIRSDPASAANYARDFLKVPELAKGDYKKELQTVLEKSSFKLVEVTEKQGQHGEAAAGYLKFAKEFPGSELVDEAYYNASAAYMNAERVDEAIKVREEFIKKFPDSPFTPEVILFLGDNYRKTVAFDRAADYYELLATKHPKFKAAPDALYNAALFRENLGDATKAIADYRLYLKTYPEREDGHDIVFTIAEIHEKRKEVDNAIKTYEEYIRVYGSKRSPDLFLDAHAKIATLAYDRGKKKEAYTKYAQLTQAYRELVKTKAKIGPTGLGAAAKAAFFQVEPKFDEYASIKLQLPQKKLAESIGDKLKRIKPLVDDYTKVVEYRHGDWAVASLYQIGRLSEEFVNAVRESPIPPELTTEAQIELYKLELQEKFGPVEDAAVEFYQKCLQTSYDYRIYSEYTRKSIEGLERVRPSQFGSDPDLRLAAGTAAVAFESSPIIEVK